MIEMTEEILIRFINNTCSDEELTAVKMWLDESEDNAAKLFEMERIAMLAGELRDNATTRKRMFDYVQQRIIADEFAKRKKKRIRLLKWMSSAAAILVIVITSVFIFKSPDVQMIKVETFSESREVTLPDGSKVYLNKNSCIEYPETFAATKREVNLTGEGFFKVAHDAAHPFTVNGQYINVTVLGTEFNFNSDENGANNVSLVEGSVKVSSVKGKESVVLVPGQKAEYDVVSGNLTVSETNAAIDAAWHDRIIPFENANVKDIANALAQLYKVKIVLKDVDTLKTYSGPTVYYESIDSTLSQLSNTLPIDFTNEEGVFVVLSRNH